MQVRIDAPKPRKEKWYEPVVRTSGPYSHVMLDGAPITVLTRALDGCTASVVRFKLASDSDKYSDALLLRLLDGELTGGLFWISGQSGYITPIKED